MNLQLISPKVMSMLMIANCQHARIPPKDHIQMVSFEECNSLLVCICKSINSVINMFQI